MLGQLSSNKSPCTVSGLGNSLMGLSWMFSEPCINVTFDGNDSISTKLRHPCGFKVIPSGECVAGILSPPITMLTDIVEIPFMRVFGCA